MSTLTFSQAPPQLFRPDPSDRELHNSMGNIPTYLFRLYGPTTTGRTTEFEVTSPAWVYPQEHLTSRMSLFERHPDDARRLIYDHLRWGDKEHEATCNLMSWTSSLLFAILYGIYRSSHGKLGHAQVPTQDLQILVVNTQLFPPGAFIRDLDLIDAFPPLTSKQIKLREWRTRCERRLYFGEFLSQGSLNIEGRCVQTSLKALIDNGVFELCPGMENKAHWHDWANRTVDLREPFRTNIAPAPTSKRDLRVALVIAESCFGTCWTLPLLLTLLSFKPRREADNNFVPGVIALFTSKNNQSIGDPH